MSDAFKEKIASYLIISGFEKTDDLTFNATSGIAKKEYDTKVGKKQANIYLEQMGDSYVLKGEYRSEGRNVLGNQNIILKDTYEDNVIKKQIQQFSQNIGITIDNSYARKLKMN